MTLDYFGDAASEEVPYDDSSVVASDRQQGAPSVEGTTVGKGYTLKRPIQLLRVRVPKRLQQFYIHPQI